MKPIANGIVVDKMHTSIVLVRIVCIKDVEKELLVHYIKLYKTGKILCSNHSYVSKQIHRFYKFKRYRFKYF